MQVVIREPKWITNVWNYLTEDEGNGAELNNFENEQCKTKGKRKCTYVLYLVDKVDLQRAMG